MVFRQYRPFNSGEFILVGADPASGGKDYCCAQFISKTNLDVPLIYHSKVTAVEMTNRLLPVLERIYDVTHVAPVIAYETNAGGIFEFERLASLNRSNKFRLYNMRTYGRIDNPPESKLGWQTNTATRPAMLSDLKDCIDNKQLRIYDNATISELFSFIINKQGKPEAEASAHDDTVTSLAIAWQLVQTETPKVEAHYVPYNKDKWVIQ